MVFTTTKGVLMNSTFWRNTGLKSLASALVSVLVFTSSASAQAAASKATPDPGLVGTLTKQLGVTPEQATGGAGALFSLAKGNLSAADFSKISSVVPGMNGFLNAAPKAEPKAAEQPKAEPSSGASNLGPLSGAASAAGSAGASAASAASGAGGGILSLGNSFKALGMSPDMATKFAPVMQQYLGSKGGSGVASIFSKAVGL
jgi:hypothetical protein